MMQEEIEARVWQRVLQQSQTQPEEEMLREWIADTLASLRSYQAMAKMTGSQRYRTMAAAEMQQAKELSALMFLIYGTRERIFSGAAEGKRALTASVRSRYAAETAAEKSFREAAERWSEHREVFGKMAQTAARHRELLRQEAQKYAVPMR